MLIHAALVDLQQPFQIDLIAFEFLHLNGGLGAEEVMHHELHLLDLYDVVLDLLALSVFVADIEP